MRHQWHTVRITVICHSRIPEPPTGPDSKREFNLHPADNKFTLKAAHPMVGGGDYCFVWPGTAASAVAHLKSFGIPIEEGPVSESAAAARA